MQKARQKVIKLRKLNPCLSNANIARLCGISRERVRVLLKEEGLSTRVPSKKKFCVICGKFIGYNATYCRNCSSKTIKIQVACSYCGNLIERNIKEIIHQINDLNYQHHFCDRKCFGKWFGKNYGRRRKYDYTQIWELHLQGYIGRQIGKMLNIPGNYVYDILKKCREERKTV